MSHHSFIINCFISGSILCSTPIFAQMPITDTWFGLTNSMNDPNNWDMGTPSDGDELIFNGAATITTISCDINPQTIGKISFGGVSYSMSGNANTINFTSNPTFPAPFLFTTGGGGFTTEWNPNQTLNFADDVVFHIGSGDLLYFHPGTMTFAGQNFTVEGGGYLEFTGSAITFTNGASNNISVTGGSTLQFDTESDQFHFNSGATITVDATPSTLFLLDASFTPTNVSSPITGGGNLKVEGHISVNSADGLTGGILVYSPESTHQSYLSGETSQLPNHTGQEYTLNQYSQLIINQSSGDGTFLATVLDGSPAGGILASRGSSKVTLTATDSTYTGGTVLGGGFAIGSGTFSLPAEDNAIPTAGFLITSDANLGALSSPVTFANGNLTIAANITTARNFNKAPDLLTLSPVGLLTINTGFTYEINGIIDLTGMTSTTPLQKGGLGTLFINNSTVTSNTLTDIFVNQGILQFPSPLSRNISTGPTSQITVIDDAGHDSTVLFNLSGTDQFQGLIRLNPNTYLHKTGAGTLQVGGPSVGDENNRGIRANGTSATVSLDAGVLQATVANAFYVTYPSTPTTFPVTVVMGNNATAVLDLNGFNNTIGNLSGGGTTGGTVSLAGGTLTLGTSNNTTYSGVIGPGPDTGNLTKVGSGTLILANTGAFAPTNFTGVTTISAGTLQAGATDTLSPHSDIVLANTAGAILDLNDFNNTIGGLSGIGPSGAVHLGTGTLTFGNDTTDTTYSGAITGTGGSLIKTGTDTFTLGATGTGTYTGSTTVNGGTFLIASGGSISNTSLVNVNSPSTLVVNGSLTSVGAVTVASGGTIKGSDGTIHGNVSGAGTVQPGNSIGTLNIVGNYTASGGTLSIEISPTSGVNSLLNVTGTAALAGGTLTVIPDAGSYIVGDTYEIITATSVTGNFSTFNFAGLNFVPIITGTTYTITIPAGGQTIFFNQTGETENSTNVEVYIKGLTIVPGSDLATVVNATNGLNNEEFTEALNQLTPALFGAFELVNLDNSTVVASIFADHIWQLPCSDRICRKELTEEDMGSRNGIWLEAFGDFEYVDQISQQNGFDANTGGVAIGYDRCFIHNLMLGVGGAYSYTSLNWKEDQGSSNINSGYAGFYGSWLYKNLSVDASTFGGYDHYNTNRNIEFTTIDRTASSNHHAFSVTNHLAASLSFQPRRLKMMPYGEVDYYYFLQNSYQEHGASSINLAVNAKTSNMLRSELGLQLSRELFYNDTCLAPYLSGSWIRKMKFSSKDYRAHFVGEPGSFVAGTFDHSIDFGALKGGFIITTDSGFTFIAGYEAEIAPKYFTQNAKVRFAYDF